MRLRHIEAIQAVLQAGSFVAAAQRLDLQPDAVQQTLEEAERQLGFLLFARSRDRLMATAETRALQPAIGNLYDQLEALQRQAHSLRQHHEPALHVDCSATLADQLLPQSLAALRRRFRDTPCQLSSQRSACMVERLLVGYCHVGISLHDPQHPRLHCVALGQGKLHLVAPRGWLSAKQKYISLPALAGQSMVGLEGEDPLSAQLDSRLQALQPAPVIQTRVQSYTMMRSMVEAGEGLAVVDPFTAIGARQLGLDVCPIAPAMTVTVYALTLAGSSPTSALKALLAIIEEKVHSLLE